MAVFDCDSLVMFFDRVAIDILRTPGVRLPMNPLKNLIWRQL
jgi:hypothetical protein